MASIFKSLMVAGLLAGSAGIVVAQQPAAKAATAAASNTTAPAKDATTAKPFAAPGTPGSPSNGETIHAQVLLDVAGFPAGCVWALTKHGPWRVVEPHNIMSDA